MVKKKILILTDDMPWGHRSIAKAIFNYLKGKERENNYVVKLAEIKAETGFITDWYVFTYRYMPESNRVLHRFSKSKMARDLLRDIPVLNLVKLKSKIERINPDLIISTYFLHSQSLAMWRKKENKKFKLWTIVADPWSINQMSFIKEVDLSLVYDEIGVKEGSAYGLEESKIYPTGWWVRPEMYRSFDRVLSRKKMGFNDDRPVIFVGGGSLGTSSLSRLLPMLLVLRNKVGFVINTGTDKLAFNLVERFLKIFRKLRKDSLVQIKHLGWIDNMAEILSGCDMVFGKAGPNFLFDVVACQKPFVAITHVGGQEDGNIDLIRKKQLGWVREKNRELLGFLKGYLEKPEWYQNRFKENIKIEAESNQKSLPMILERIKKEL